MATSQRHSRARNRRRNKLAGDEDGKQTLDSAAVSAGGDRVENSSRTITVHDLALSNEEETEIHAGLHRSCLPIPPEQTYLEVNDDEVITDVSGSAPNAISTLDAIVDAQIVTTSVGANVLKRIAPTIAEGVCKRRDHGREKEGLTVIACENMIGATSHLQECVTVALKSKGIMAPDELLEHVGFPNCEVDRIVPAFEGKSRLEVGVEGFYEWVVEKSKVKGSLGIKGMQLQDSLQPFLERKLYTLNCGHAILAFLGYLRGYKTMAEAIADDHCKGTTKKALHESGAALIRRHGFDEKQHHDYIERTMTRYANPNIKDELSRVSRNPLRKLSPNERLVGAVNMCKEFNLPRPHLIKGIAAAFHFDVQEDEEAVQLVHLVREKGIEDAIEETTSFKKGSQDHSDVLKEYHLLGKIPNQDGGD